MKPVRSFAIQAGMAFLPCFLSVVPIPLPAAEETRKPNIVVILTDDHGWADIGAQGVDKDIRTPNIDRLAREGVRFSRGYVTAPQCVPSRAGLISGRHQNAFGVEDNQKGPLPLEVLTIPERLKRAGYVTGMCGKWHLDLVRSEGDGQRESDRFLPQAHGFDEYWCGAMRSYHASHDLKGKPLAGGGTIIDKRFRISVQTEAALAFLDRRAADPGRPWFLYLPWFAPHVPLESPEPWFSRTPANLPLERRQALAMIAAMDDGVGMLREKIRTMGAESDTLVFFIGDNGAPLRKKAWNGSLNLPLTGEKGMLTDGGVRVPFVAAWPGRLPAGKTCGDPVSTLDVGATAVALAGLPRDEALDGVDLMPFLTGEIQAAPHDALYWRWRSQAAVLEYPWKLIHLGKTGRYLFNVTTPDGETRNLISRNPEIAARLENRLRIWSATLKPPGPPEKVNAQDNAFYADHVDKSVAGDPVPADELYGWRCRGGELVVRDGLLVFTPDPKEARNQRPFLYAGSLDVGGPARMRLRLRCSAAGAGEVSWRCKGQKDFIPENRKSFDLMASEEWREIKVALPAEGQVIHLRLGFSSDAVVTISDIEVVGEHGRISGRWHPDEPATDGAESKVGQPGAE